MAFEILDLSRVLFGKQLSQKENEPTEAASVDDDATATDAPAEEERQSEDEAGTEAEKLAPSTRHIMERLADTHDLLAEISLENER